MTEKGKDSVAQSLRASNVPAFYLALTNTLNVEEEKEEKKEVVLGNG